MATASEKNYIYKAYKRNLIREMEREFEKENPQAKVTFDIDSSSYEKIKIVVMDRKFKFVKAYIATEFNCWPEAQNMLDFNFKEYPKSEATILDDYVRTFVLKFLNNKFEETFENDYKEHLVKKADLDLGKTTSV